MNKKDIEIAKETIKLLNDYPELSYSEAFKKAKEVINNVK